ncbi:hypothetical protein LAJ57_12875, partial [Streptococcus pneumoniae]|uniref:hypothetical protein n=1 Tax=Streptococcus pneumoniae TaxID=1313 RepID=UPI001CBB0DEF
IGLPGRVRTKINPKAFELLAGDKTSGPLIPSENDFEVGADLSEWRRMTENAGKVTLKRSDWLELYGSEVEASYPVSGSSTQNPPQPRNIS